MNCPKCGGPLELSARGGQWWRKCYNCQGYEAIVNDAVASNARLEDFGVRGTATPEERLEEYRRQCRQLPVNSQAPFWLSCLNRDKEVAKIAGFKTTRKGGRKK